MADMSANAGMVLAALVLEACIGYPRVLFASIGHPVTWIGRLIAMLERNWNVPRTHAALRRFLGVLTVLIIVGIPVLIGYAFARTADHLNYGVVLVIVVAASGLAQRSLYEHVQAVLSALSADDVVSAREAVSHVVGRDTDRLNGEAIAVAAIESLAESFNDAVVAPVFWFVVGGLPGLLAYKAINTADSMIGHKEERWRAFGWAAARLDDIVNLVPARIAGVLLAAVAGRGFKIMLRDASKHASPNAGWPEAALAGALDVRLGGPAYYDGVLHERPHFGDGGYARVADLGRALALYKRSCLLLWAVLACLCSLPLIF